MKKVKFREKYVDGACMMELSTKVFSLYELKATKEERDKLCTFIFRSLLFDSAA